MKKILFVLLITCILLTGCGKSEEDINDAKDPDKFVKESFKEYHKTEIELVKKDSKLDANENETAIMQYKLKDDESFIFDVCAYWKEEGLFANTVYTYDSNYEDIYNMNLLKKHFDTSTRFNLTFENKNRESNNVCSYEIHNPIIEINNLDDLNDLYNEFLAIKEEKEIFSISTAVKYQDKKVNITLNSNISNEEVQNKLDELKKSV